MILALNIVLIVVAVLLIIAILLQARGSGLSTAFGGSGEFYRSKRSIEKMLIWATVALASVFGIISVLLLIPR